MNSLKSNPFKYENPKFIFKDKIQIMFKTIIQKERKTNDLKLSLFAKTNSNLQNFFSEINSENKNYINIKNIISYLQKYSISYNYNIIRRFIQTFDKHKNFYLIYDDFIKIFTPINSNYINILENDEKIECLFLNILSNTIDLLMEINSMIGDIRKTENFTTYEAFMGITKGNTYIDEEFLDHFLKHEFNKGEIIHLINLMFGSKDNLVNYESFQDFFMPINLENVNINNSNYIFQVDHKIKMKNNICDNLDTKYLYIKKDVVDKRKINFLRKSIPRRTSSQEFHPKTKLYNKYNISHSEIQYTPRDKDNSILSNLEKKEDKKINNDNFSLGRKSESEKEIILNKNNISQSLKSVPIKNNNESSKDRDSFRSKLNRETLKKKLKENTSINIFMNYIQILLKYEKKTIEFKEKLSLREDISLKNLYFIFDINKMNEISKDNFQLVCKKLLEINPSFEQISLVYKRYDLNKDGNLNLKEFFELIRPLKEEYTSFLFSKKKNNSSFDNLNNKSKNILSGVIKEIIDAETDYNEFKNNNFVEIDELWKIISMYCRNNCKGLTKSRLSKLLSDNKFIMSHYEIDIIFNKMDYDKDEMIGYNDLKQEFETDL